MTAPKRLQERLAAAIPLFIAAAIACAIAASPASKPAARFAMAFAAPCSTALPLYTSLAADGSVPDSLRAIACDRLADYSFAFREYDTAREYYNKAARLDERRGAFRYRSGLAALGNGDTTEAVKILQTLARSGEGGTRCEAALLLGEIAFQRGDYEKAMTAFRGTGPFIRTNAWSVRATVGKLLCARRLGHADSAAAYEKLLSPYSRTLLEKELLAPTRPPRGEGAAGAEPDGRGAPGGEAPLFTLQVGAFGSRERADTLITLLVKKFAAIYCVPAPVSSRTIFRVWIGDFRTREEADRFGKERLRPEGLVYRVVAK